MSVSERNDLQPPPHHLFSFRNNYFLYVQGEPFVFYFTVSTIGISWPARYLCLIPCYIFLHTPGARGSAPPTPLQGTNLQASLTEKPQQWIQLTLSGSPHQSHDGPQWLVPRGDFSLIRALLLLLFSSWKPSDLLCLQDKVQIPQQDICSPSKPRLPWKQSLRQGLGALVIWDGSQGAGGRVKQTRREASRNADY